MTGRGIDQVLPFSNDPVLYEHYVRNAKRYVQLAEEVNGPINKPVDFAYIWGDALDVFQHVSPDARIINLETSVTTSDDDWPGKGIHYRMHPGNIRCLTEAGVDCCVLANNHVLDWGVSGLEETLQTLTEANIKTAGAGHNLDMALAPAELAIADKGRVLVFAFGMESSGVYSAMAATREKPGINFLSDLSERSIRQIRQQVLTQKRAGDIVVVSIHWGGNWGYEIPEEQVWFARRLIDTAGVDIIHGHSSHHFKGIEVYHDKLVLYGCGDLLTDYEGIGGHKEYRGDLGLMYFVYIDPANGRLIDLQMVPMQIRRFQLHRASKVDSRWMQDILNREGKAFNSSIETRKDNYFLLRWL